MYLQKRNLYINFLNFPHSKCHSCLEKSIFQKHFNLVEIGYTLLYFEENEVLDKFQSREILFTS